MTKTFLSIGAGPGIGLATAQRFAREGYRIVLAARNGERLAASAAALRAATGAEVDFRTVDASDPVAVAALTSGIGDALHVVHYNAGVLHYDKDAKLLTRGIDDESTASLISDISINVTSALSAIHAALPALRKQASGSLLLTGGGLGVQPSGSFLTLSVGKAAVRAAGLALFEPLKAEGIHVATVTVARLVSPESRHSEEIAEAFWQLHAQPRDTWTYETSYS
ncbi:SDR family NAD(P)-dependent oxidoreductase [Variovorax sp. LjRoot290]|uniref:SDR family NAD(P)-dependent oxidoreductase n=1 Tax=Variovorax sp. LjRoot290 TaxID=3342316 RepID=UPI003ED0DBA7